MFFIGKPRSGHWSGLFYNSGSVLQFGRFWAPWRAPIRQPNQCSARRWAYPGCALRSQATYTPGASPGASGRYKASRARPCADLYQTSEGVTAWQQSLTGTCIKRTCEPLTPFHYQTQRLHPWGDFSAAA